MTREHYRQLNYQEETGMRLIYLGSPYTHTLRKIRKARVAKVREALAYFANNAKNLCLYSPISHWAGVAEDHELPHDFTFWVQQDFHMIRQSTALWVLTVPGWKQSYGLRQEIEFASDLKKPVLYVVQVDSDFHVYDSEPEEVHPHDAPEIVR